MTEIIRPGAGLLFMKVGTHANEELEDIIKRKQKKSKTRALRCGVMVEIHATRQQWFSPSRRSLR